MELLTQLKGFKFVTTLVLLFKKIESENKTMYDTFYSHSKAGTIINKVTFMMCLNQSILKLYET